MCKEKYDRLEKYALCSDERKKQLKAAFREYPEKNRTPDPFRKEYRRDCDRILWSSVFRRMQNKTQVFAHNDDDHFRRRLTHSIEVAAIARSIARHLRLNEDATEAIALGHDLGHTPFGHAGEDALNSILKEKYKELPANTKEPIPLRGFNHCAHAIEMVSRIETLNGTTQGLNLTFDVRDGILKHIYHQKQDAQPLEERPFSALSEIVKCEKYKQYGNNYGSLEAQCVWLADKLTYLFGDLEDAIRAGIFKFDIFQQRKVLDHMGNIVRFIKKPTDANHISINETDIERIKSLVESAMKPLECQIIQVARETGLVRTLAAEFKSHYDNDKMKELYRKSKNIQDNHPNDSVRQYLFWRNKAITVMLKNCVKATEDRLSEANIESIADVLEHGERLVDVSDPLKMAWRGPNNFYSSAMVDVLFKHRTVRKHTYNAERKIRTLFKIYDDNNSGYELIPEDYKKMTKNIYNDTDFDFGITGPKKEYLLKILTIKNYIAGMSDAFVNQTIKEYTE